MPLAGAFQQYPYLAFWALAGVRMPTQQGLDWRKVARLNREYLSICTTYLSRAELTKVVIDIFGNVRFVEGAFIKHSYGRLRHLYPLTRLLPFLPSLVSTFHTRAMFFRKPESGTAPR